MICLSSQKCLSSMICLFLLFDILFSYPLILQDIIEYNNTQIAILIINEDKPFNIYLDTNSDINNVEDWKTIYRYEVEGNEVYLEIPSDLSENKYYAFRLSTDEYNSWTQPFYKIEDEYSMVEKSMVREMSRKKYKSKTKKKKDDSKNDWINYLGPVVLGFVLLCLLIVFISYSSSNVIL